MDVPEPWVREAAAKFESVTQAVAVLTAWSAVPRDPYTIRTVIDDAIRTLGPQRLVEGLVMLAYLGFDELGKVKATSASAEIRSVASFAVTATTAAKEYLANRDSDG